MSVYFLAGSGYNIQEFAKEEIMMKIAVCDSSQYDREKILNFCKKFFCDKPINYELREYSSGESLLVEDFPDVLFLDTEIREIDGLMVKDILYKMKADTKIHFISNKVEKMQEAFGRNVYAFSTKPVSYEAFYKNMVMMVEDVYEQRNFIYCKVKNEIVKVLYKDIFYIQACGRYTKIFQRDAEKFWLCDKSIGEWYLEVDNTELLSCHRSYLVNVFCIKAIDKDIELINGSHIPLSLARKKEFYDTYNAYIRSNVKNGNRPVCRNMEETTRRTTSVYRYDAQFKA